METKEPLYTSESLIDDHTTWSLEYNVPSDNDLDKQIKKKLKYFLLKSNSINFASKEEFVKFTEELLSSGVEIRNYDVDVLTRIVETLSFHFPEIVFRIKDHHQCCQWGQEKIVTYHIKNKSLRREDKPNGYDEPTEQWISWLEKEIGNEKLHMLKKEYENYFNFVEEKVDAEKIDVPDI